MGSISVYGIGFALLTGVLASSTLSAPAKPVAGKADLLIDIEKLRNGRGMIRACLTQAKEHFPECQSDPRAFRFSARVAQGGRVSFEGLPVGNYALSVIHDENANGRLDTFARVPKEGFGFSRNPAIRFGPPRYEQVRFDLAPGLTRQTVRMHYLL
jgi:uncharacterized protein (DUF2141 family)